MDNWVGLQIIVSYINNTLLWVTELFPFRWYPIVNRTPQTISEAYRLFSFFEVSSVLKIIQTCSAARIEITGFHCLITSILKTLKINQNTSRNTELLCRCCLEGSLGHWDTSKYTKDFIEMLYNVPQNCAIFPNIFINKINGFTILPKQDDIIYKKKKIIHYRVLYGLGLEGEFKTR